MEVFVPFSIMVGISFLLIAFAYFGKVINDVSSIDSLREENKELRKENSLLRSVKGVVEE